MNSFSDNLLNDIALLELAEDAEISQYVGLMGINEDDQKDLSRLHCTIAGWGQVSPRESLSYHCRLFGKQYVL